MIRQSIAVVGILAGLTMAATAPALAGPEVNTAPGLVLVDGKPAPGLAVHGHDVVAYFTKGKPIRGEARFATVYKEATYRFSTKANLDAFKANPAKYEPAYGGYCAYGVSVGAKFDGNPNYWKIVDGKLYLNLDRDIAAAFDKDVNGSLKKAEANWPGLKDKLPSEIN